jgi:hypothetical protein
MNSLLFSGRIAPMVYKFPNTRTGKREYLAKLETDDGFIANCCAGSPEGYMLHRASCPFLNTRKNKANPIKAKNGIGKIWAATLKELEQNAVRQGGKASRCGCLRRLPVDEYDTDMKRESPLVVPGGQVESNRKKH